MRTTHIKVIRLIFTTPVCFTRIMSDIGYYPTFNIRYVNSVISRKRR
jgi:hypothetical protein